MNSRDHREVHTTSSVVRTLSPTRPLSPQQELDSNLDSILEDLQASVSRPSSSLAMNGHSSSGSHVQQPGTTYSTREVQYLTSANPTTVIPERAVSPSNYGDPQQKMSYQTASYRTYNVSSSGSSGVPAQRSISPSPKEARMQQNINQLDTLLDDLQQAREGTMDSRHERGTHSTAVNNIGIDPGLLEPMPTSTPHGVTRVTKTTKTTYHTAEDPGSVRPTRATGAQRELIFDASPVSSHPSRSRHTPSPVGNLYQRNETTRDIYSDGSYIEERNRSPSRTVSPQRQVQNNITSTNRIYNYSTSGSPTYPEKTTIAEVVDGLPVPLTHEILPNPSTKVTTTVRTYTYELPGESQTAFPNDGYVYQVSEPSTQGTLPKNQTIIYRNESSTNTSQNIKAVPINYGSVPSNQEPHPSDTTIIYKKDVHNTTTNVQNPAYSGYIAPGPAPSPVPGKQTVIYKVDTTNTTHNVHGSPGGPAYPSRGPNYPSQGPGYSHGPGYPSQVYPPQTHPPEQTTVIYKHDTTNTTTRNIQNLPNRPKEPVYPSSPSGPGGPTTIIYKRDVTNTTHNIHGAPGSPGGPDGHPPSGNYPPHDGQPRPGYPNDPTVITYKYDITNTTRNIHEPPVGISNPPGSGGYPLRGGYPPHDGHPYPGYPNDPSVVTYKYSTHTTNSQKYPGPDDHHPMPGPFPTDKTSRGPTGDGNPPKRLDDLMASFSSPGHPNEHYNNVTHYPSKPPPTQVVEVAVSKDATDLSGDSPKAAAIKEQGQTRNVAGPAVYYPPGHEMFARKEESGGGYHAQGGMMKSSGKYMYESESKSKSKTSSGAAVVPLCLPLCCGLPCVIM